MKNDLLWAQEHFINYLPKYTKYEQFYEGDHPSFITDEIRNAFGELFGGYVDNLCPVVVDELAGRVTLSGFSGDQTNASAVQTVTEIWRKERMASKSLLLHEEVFRKGDGYLIIWPDPEDPKRPRVYVNKAENIAVLYEDDGMDLRVIEAVKQWVIADSLEPDKKRLRINRYTLNTLEKYVSSNYDTTFPSSTDDLLPFKDDSGNFVYANPYSKVPVFHFSNSTDQLNFGSSELVSVIPNQLALNKSVIDLLVAGEFFGFPQRWATGVQIPKDPKTGEPVDPWQTAINRIWTHPKPEAKFGQFDQVDLDKGLKVINDFRLEIARVSRTPLHLFMLNTGDFPSGEALKTAESPIVNKANKRMLVLGDVWINAMSFAAEIAGYSEDPGTLDPIWRDPGTRSELTITQVLLNLKALGMSAEECLRTYGYDDDKIAMIMAEKAEENRLNAERMAVAFNAGNVSDE